MCTTRADAPGRDELVARAPWRRSSSRSENSDRVGLPGLGVRRAQRGELFDGSSRRACRRARPCRRASPRSPIVGAVAGIAAVTTTSTSSSAASRSGTVRARSCCDASHGPMRSSVGDDRDELRARFDAGPRRARPRAGGRCRRRRTSSRQAGRRVFSSRALSRRILLLVVVVELLELGRVVERLAACPRCAASRSRRSRGRRP